ncbi:MAG: hypothetical protein EA366_15280 [Spirulina sp. DLM2.Bin59]|nr:MAG: hypothetical protein EA366_15280 [Spirulina sp. DLM2.Bin59]
MRIRQILLIAFVALGLGLATLVQGMGQPAFSCEYHQEAYEGLVTEQLEAELTGSGLIGRVHGAAPAMAVLTVREPDHFFNHREFSLIPANGEVREALGAIHRHDRICIQGEWLHNPSSQPHLLVKGMEVLETWQGVRGYEHQTQLPEDLLGRDGSLVGVVHAVGTEGDLLVVDYGDGVVPVVVTDPVWTAGLYRGDIVRLNYGVQRIPPRPPHLRLNERADQPLAVLDAIASWHNQPKTLTGKLVKFPQSPQIQFDVYGLAVETLGQQRIFTLVNFEDPEVFGAIRQRLATLWEENEGGAIAGRNYLINPGLTLTATGTINVISPEQANPQILLATPEAIQQ